jgi:hypothetical protein
MGEKGGMNITELGKNEQEIISYPVVNGEITNIQIPSVLVYDNGEFLEGKSLKNIEQLVGLLLNKNNPLLKRFRQDEFFEEKVYFSLCGFGCNNVKESIEKIILNRLRREQKQATHYFALAYASGSLVLSFPEKEKSPIFI